MHCWARYLFLLIVAVLAVGHMVSACGQKGPLYLPEQASDGEADSGPAPLPGPDTSDEGLEALEEVPVVPPGPEVN
jgi:predicted small lipoprotein YifL